MRLAYTGGDETAVVLAGKNEHPVPTFEPSDTGFIEGVHFGAPPHPDSYQAYIKQLTSLNSGGGHVALRGTQMLRQNFSRVPWERPFYDQKLPLITGDPLPDINKDSRVPRPTSIRVEAVTVAGALGYPEGPMWLSYAGIVGSPTTSPFLTSAAPPIEVELSQGQILPVTLPDIPEGWSGIALLLSPTNGGFTDLRIQRRIDLRGRSVPEVTLSGPYNSGGRRVIPAGRPNADNTTFIASENEYASPGVAWASSNLNTRQMSTRLSYRFLTPRGQTASQRERAFNVSSLRKGKALTWRPRNPPRGATAWIPEFLGADGKWYTLESAERGYPLSRSARIHTNQISSDVSQDEDTGQFTSVISALWKRQGDSPVELARQYEDESGLSDPSEPLGEPEIRTPEGGSLLPPGRYSARTTNVASSDSSDSESAPSDPGTVTLRDSGIARGEAATGVSDQAIRVYRPPSQEIANARFTEINPATGLADLEWEFYEPEGITITAGEGLFSVDDETDSEDIAQILGTRPLPIGNRRLFYIRHFAKVSRAGGGRFELRVRFADENNDTLSNRPLLKQSSTTSHLRERGVWTRKTIAPAHHDPDIDMPPDTYYVQFIWRNVGLTDEGESVGRDIAWEASQIGLFNGKAGRRKRYPLDLGLSAPSADRAPVPALEPVERPDLPGGYCRVVEDPPDGAPVYSQEGVIEESFTEPVFEQEPHDSVSAEVVDRNGGALKLTADNASGLRHVYSYPLSGTFAALEIAVTIKDLFTDGVTALGYIQGGGGPLLRVNLTSSGSLALVARNGNSILSTVASRDVTDGDTLNLLIGMEGIGTQDGYAVMYWRCNGQRMPGVYNESLDLTAEEITGAYYGLWGTGSNVSGSVYFERARISRDVPPADDVIPGNYVEYYGPEGTSRHPENFITGMKIPLTAGERYTLSAYLGTEGAGIGTSLLKTAVKDAAGNVLLENPYLASNLRGDNYWFRAHHTYVAPSGAAYLEVTRNNVGEGLIRAMGFQHERGELTPFTNENATSGYLRGRMKLSTPGRSHFTENYDTDGWLSKELAITHEEDETPLTSHQFLHRTADSGQSLNYASWRGLLTDTPLEEQKRDFVEVEIALYSSDATLSPSLAAAHIDVGREVPVLTMADGTEFEGGAVVENLQPLAPSSRASEIAYANGSLGFSDYARSEGPDRVKLEVRCWERSTANLINRLAAREPLIAEYQGMRYILRVTGDFELEGTQDINGMRTWGSYPGTGGPPDREFFSFTGEAEAVVVSSEAWR